MQPNVITRDRKAGVQVGELVRVTRTGFERLPQYEAGAFPRRIVAPFTEDGHRVAFDGTHFKGREMSALGRKRTLPFGPGPG